MHMWAQANGSLRMAVYVCVGAGKCKVRCMCAWVPHGKRKLERCAQEWCLTVKTVLEPTTKV
jgi:hypothetical protein